MCHKDATHKIQIANNTLRNNYIIKLWHCEYNYYNIMSHWACQYYCYTWDIFSSLSSLCRWQQTQCLCVCWSWNGFPTAASVAYHGGCLFCHRPQEEVTKVNWKEKISLFTNFTYCSLSNYYVLSCMCGIYLLLFSRGIKKKGNFLLFCIWGDLSMRRWASANVYRKWKCAVYIPLDLRRYLRYRNHSDHPIIRFPRALC